MRDMRGSSRFLAILSLTFQFPVTRVFVCLLAALYILIHSDTQLKNSTNALTTTHTVKKLPALFTHALHTNSPSSLTIPAHYDGVLMNKSVTDTHTNTFAQNALKVKTMSHLLCGNLSKQHVSPE